MHHPPDAVGFGLVMDSTFDLGGPSAAPRADTGDALHRST
jgi:hypothetical protein